MSSETAIVIGLFSKAFDMAKELGISVRIQPPTTPAPKESYPVGMQLMVFEPVGAAMERAIKGEKEVLRSTSISKEEEVVSYGS